MDWAQVVEHDPTGILVADDSGRVEYLNPSAARVLGCDLPEQLIGRPVEALLAEIPAVATSSGKLPTGQSVWYLVGARIGGSEPDLFAVQVADALAGTLNVRRTLGRVVDLAVPRLGRWAAVTLWDNDRVRRVSRGPGSCLDDRAIPARRLDDAGRKRIQQSVQAELTEELVRFPAELVELGASPDAATALLADGPVGVVTVALRAHGMPLGTLTVASAPGTDPTVVEELARRAAVALSSARIYEERSTLARTLRSSLLPARLPSPPGLRLGSAYRPALEATEIGGDFYDVRPDGPGWNFSLGDVCGKGVEAAVLTGQVRQSLSTVSLVEKDPAERLRLLNAALLSTDGTSFVTMLHGVVETRGHLVSVTIAGGGHPYPLLRRVDGTVEEVAVPGPIIGMLPEVTFRAARLELAKGETLVCFTDGLSEARGADGMLGVDGLSRVVSDCKGMTAQAIAERLLQASIEYLDGRPHDDMAVLAVQVDPAARAG